MNNFSIKLQSLKNGNNEFSFQVKDKFFENNCISDIKHADLIVKSLIIKNDDKLKIEIKISGVLNDIPCDICTEKISINFSAFSNYILKISDKNCLTDEIIFVKEDDGKINLNHLIYETIILNSPKKRQHKLDENGNKTCNSEMLKLIEKYTKKQNKKIDPRWDALKNINYK